MHESSAAMRPVPGVPDRHAFEGVVKLTYYGGEVEIDVDGTDLVEFLEGCEGKQVRVEIEVQR